MVVPPELDALVSVDPSSGCWLWGGLWHRRRRTPWWNGPGVNGRRRSTTAARYVWEAASGRLPEGRLMRLCSTPVCVAPEHHRDAGPPRAHGTESGHRGGCRCPRCLEARHRADTARARLAGVPPRRRVERLCVVCGGQLPPPKRGKPRLYCSARCGQVASRRRKQVA